MVVKIMEAASSMKSALEYNEKKVESGQARLLDYFSMDAPPPDGIRETFARYERINERSRDVSFHMSINPAEGENLSDEDIVRLSMDILERLGYADQPIAIYEHNDIDRKHYHVITIRTDKNGKKINDFREHVRCQEVLSRLAVAYGYKVGNGNKEQLLELNIDVRRFNPKAGHVVAQMEAIFKECLTYHFTTFEQFLLILRHHGIQAEERTGENTILVLQGLNLRGKPCTGKIDELATSIDMYRSYAKRASDCYLRSMMPRREKEKVGRVGAVCLTYSKSEQHFLNMMKKKGIEVVLYRDKKTGTITGANCIDHLTKCAFKAGELSPLLTVKMFNDTEQSGQWSTDKQTEERPETNSGPTLGDLLSGLAGGNGKSREQDMKDKKKKKGRRM